jgi:hypothetical protein
MPISPNEMKKRALSFSKEWANTTNEEAEAKEFLIQFLNIFDITRRKVATFEHRVKKLDEGDGYIDLLWKGRLLVEMKSRGKDLSKAYTQAKDYCHGLKDYDIPKIIMVCDFHHFHVYDENADCNKFTLIDLSKNLNLFDVLTGRERRTFTEQDPVNLAAAELMGKLHDKLKDIGYDGHYLELYLVRLLFILFADDTGIFDRDGFHAYLENNTREDGADLAMHLSSLFDILNREHSKRLKNIDEDLARFPYVNGKLFEEVLPPASFDSDMRKMLLDACLLDWGKISPAIFGSLFQSVMDPKARRNLGAHYTSEKNIFKVIRPLFLDDLWEEFNKCRHNKNELRKLHLKISKLRFLDPACGCGNFLIITYRELRLLEMEIVAAILEGQTVTDIGTYFLVDVDQFYGIEYEEFPAQIAQVAMWLMDHQMNVIASQRFGDYYVRLPLRKSATIVHGNALRIDWQSLITPMPWEKEEPKFHFIMGNPPFLGTAYQSEEQKKDLKELFSDIPSYGMLDYVSGWYVKAGKYLDQLANFPVQVAFVSTNSITQGEQVAILWSEMYWKYKCKINFAHRTFKWGNDAKGNAAVHVVIIGFSKEGKPKKTIHFYEHIKSEPIETSAKNINPYLVEGSDNFLRSLNMPICNIPKMQSGSAARDGGFLILTQSEKMELVKANPETLPYLRRFISGDDFINNITRWCIWLKGKSPTELRNINVFKERFMQVRAFRENSTRTGTKKMASLPYLFAEERQPDFDFLLIPKVSSENRTYIPIAYLTKDFIVSDKTFVVPNTTIFHFGVLTSLMHNTWMRFTCGRLKSDYSYSNTIVYNNYPWPLNPTDKQKQAVETSAQAVLDARATFPDASLADLYDPNTMPTALVKAHQALDKAVDLCYRPQPFPNETKRIEYLFELYDQYTAGLFKEEKKGRKK